MRKTTLLTLACLSLAGCLGSGSSGGGAAPAARGGTPAGGGGTPAGGGGSGGGMPAVGGSNFDTEFMAVQGLLPTQTPIIGSASYLGEVAVLTNANAGNADERVVGDLTMIIDFDATSDPITATVDNLEGEVNGVQTTIGGALSTAHATNQVNAISATTLISRCKANRL